MQQSAVIFDFDGTITEPYLDFDRIREDIGLPPGPILEAIDRMADTDRERAVDILHRHEQEAAENATLRRGAAELVDSLHDAGRPLGVLTRNARRWVTIVIEKHGLQLDTLRTREDGAIKPSPEGVLDLCRQLHADPKQSWMIGDHLYDLQSGRQAGAKTVLVAPEHERSAIHEEWAHEADFSVGCLTELAEILAIASSVER